MEMHERGRQLDELAAEQKLMRLRQDRHGKAIRDLKAKVFHTDPDEDTGVHQLKDLREYVEKQEAENKDRRDSVWWRRKRWEWVMAAGGFVLANLVLGTAGLIWYLLTKK
ncbi:MAG: hypothetical protein EHM89_13145 [Acidobacteria bacterium]|nr:MAG: hypothetical protein EHM89_13145 [Acidobacteriota bacterium]